MDTGTRRRVGNVEEQTFVDLLRTTDLLSRRPAQVLKTEDLSSTQYNVLRILRGTSEGLSCSEIANRMITRDPDITRLLDRLEKRKLVRRNRDTKDRRAIVVTIATPGLELLARLDTPIQETHRAQLKHMGEDRLKQLRELLAACCPAEE